MVSLNRPGADSGTSSRVERSVRPPLCLAELGGGLYPDFDARFAKSIQIGWWRSVVFIGWMMSFLEDNSSVRGLLYVCELPQSDDRDLC